MDRLLSSIGQDLLDGLYRSTRDEPRRFLRLSVLGVLTTCYVFLHSLLKFVQIVSLNVAINSKNQSLTTLLISHNFVELKVL